MAESKSRLQNKVEVTCSVDEEKNLIIRSSLRHCCVKGCKNSSDNQNLDFYVFPSNNPKNRVRRQQWIQAVIENCKFSEDWQPMKYTLMCSEHFVGGKKNDDPKHLAYIPTLFPDLTLPLVSPIRKNKIQAKKIISNNSEQNEGVEIIDHNYSKLPKMSNTFIKVEKEESINIENSEAVFIKEEISTTATLNFSCQVNMSHQDSVDQHVNYMICNQMIENGLNCAETQAKLKLKTDSKCNLPKKSSFTTSKDFSFSYFGLQSVKFEGISTVHSNNDLIHLCGVSFKVFNLLLKNLPVMEKIPIGNANRLMIFLMKMKLGIDYEALAVIFGLSPYHITNIFITTLKHFVLILKIKWPDRDFIRLIMPDLFKKLSPQCRAMVDFIDVHVEVPNNEHERIAFFSTYKNWHNFKFFIACAPNGSIIFKSTCYLDVKSDEFVIKECEFLNFLEKGDTLLANKEFPSLKNKVEKKGVLYQSPPFTKNASLDPLDIQVKQYINKIRSFKILSTLPSDLFLQIDDVVHICCCLINLNIMHKQ